MVALVEQQALIAIPLSAIPVSADVSFSLYLRNDRQEYYPLVQGGDSPVKAADLDRLRRQGIRVLYLDASEHRRYQQYLRQNLAHIVADEATTPLQRVSVLNQVVREVLDETFRSGNLNKIVDETKELGRHAVELICRSDFAPGELTAILYHDYGTFTHSANVAYYSVLLAQALGWSDKRELSDVAVGALLHDIGKIDVPAAIINKTDKLSTEEAAVVKRHPTDGFLKLQSRTDLTFGQLMMVYQHHERGDGRGYPVALYADEISGWARICSVADVFEALTANRPYRRRLTDSAALELMGDRGASSLDQQMVKCWKAVISSN